MLLVGTGNMAAEYAKVLMDFKVQFTVVGRSLSSAEKFENRTGVKALSGGIDYAPNIEKIKNHQYAIVAVGVEDLYSVTKSLLFHGIKNILVEKPGALELHQLAKLCELSNRLNANILVAYNRRFYSSVRRAREIINSDGGVRSFFFDFTEWSHEIINLAIADKIKHKWIIANSSHVIDLAFFLGASPENIATTINGYLNWHPTGSLFSGSGMSKSGAVFSYHANWDSAGRWSIQVVTEKRKLKFEPLEKLFEMKRESLEYLPVNVFEEKEKYFKPGLYNMVESFINQKFKSFCTIGDQVNNYAIYSKIGGYQ